MFEIFYKAKFCGGPLDGFAETQRAVNGILLDAIGRSHPGESGFEFARYVRDGFPDSQGVVRYNWDASAGESDSPQPVERTPEAQATPGEGTRQGWCTLTDEEREAIRRAMDTLNAIEDVSPTASASDAMAAARLRALLERTK